MAVFGAPVAHENDPERALRTALTMLERMASLSGRWEACFGGPVALHVGVNTGSVVAGPLRAGGDPAGRGPRGAGDTGHPPPPAGGGGAKPPGGPDPRAPPPPVA